MKTDRHSMMAMGVNMIGDVCEPLNLGSLLWLRPATDSVGLSPLQARDICFLISSTKPHLV